MRTALALTACVVLLHCAPAVELTQTQIDQRSGVAADKGWSFVGYVPPVGRTGETPFVNGVGVDSKQVWVGWSTKVTTQQDDFVDLHYGQLSGEYVERALPLVFFDSPALVKRSAFSMRGSVPRQFAWDDSNPTRFHVATTGPVIEHIAQADELVEAAAFDDADVFHYAYGSVATGELGVVRINADASRVRSVFAPTASVGRIDGLAFDDSGAVWAGVSYGTLTSFTVALLKFEQGVGTKVAELDLDPKFFTGSALVWTRGGKVYVRVQRQLIPEVVMLRFENGALVRVPYPDAAEAQVSVHLTSDGTLTYGISDPKGGNGATVLQLQGDALVPVGSRGFSTLACTPGLGSDGANLYATVTNPIGDTPGFAVVCHGPSCLTWKAPLPPAAGTGSCVTTSSNTLICTEWLGFSGGDDRDQKLNCQSSNGTLSAARCLTANLVGGCQLTRSDGSTVTNWYYSPTMVSIVKLLCMNQSKTFVSPP